MYTCQAHIMPRVIINFLFFIFFNLIF